MSSAEKESVSLEEKLFTVRRISPKDSHIKVDSELCKQCSGRICTCICPVEVFVWNADEETIEVRYENCLECGTCRVACEMYAIEWSNPLWGEGISYRDS